MIGKTAVGKSRGYCTVVATTIPSIAVVATVDTTAAAGSIPRWPLA